MLVSIIIPAYNSERTINRALASADLVAEPEMEIICVNDGSTDDTGLLIERFAANARHRVVCRDIPNGGVSNARNLGVSIASGEWICFLDADDAIDHQGFGRVLNLLSGEYALDYVKASFRLVGTDGSSDMCFVSKDMLIKAADMPKLRMAVAGCPGGGYMNTEYLGCICGSFFKKSIIESNHLCMRTDLRFMEDMQFQLNYLGYCQNGRVSSDITYEYMATDGSATRSWSSEQETSLLNSLGALTTALEDDDDLKCRVEPRFAYYIILTAIDRQRRCGSSGVGEIGRFLKTDQAQQLIASFGSFAERRGVLAGKHLAISQFLKLLAACLHARTGDIE